MTKTRRAQKPTTVSAVEACLKSVDDFLTVKHVMTATGHTANRIHAALHHLKAHTAADCLQCEGQLWWFLTPLTDNRVKVVEMRAEEEPGSRKPRGARRQRKESKS